MIPGRSCDIEKWKFTFAITEINGQVSYFYHMNENVSVKCFGVFNRILFFRTQQLFKNLLKNFEYTTKYAPKRIDGWQIDWHLNVAPPQSSWVD